MWTFANAMGIFYGFLYGFFWWLMTPFLPLFFFVRYVKRKEDKKSFGDRFLGGFLSPTQGLRGCVWLHGASIGEIRCALGVLKRLQIPDSVPILITTVTLTGAKCVEKASLKEVHHYYMPLDHPISVFLFLKKHRPRAAVWFESEIWPNILRALWEKKIPAYAMNAHVSKKSQKRWRLLGSPFLKRLLKAFKGGSAQDEATKTFFEDHGMYNLWAVGNLKFLNPPLQKSPDVVRHVQDLFKHAHLLASNIHPGEEEVLKGVFQKRRTKDPSFWLIVIPRHPQNSATMAEQFSKAGQVFLYTDVRDKKVRPAPPKGGILIVDTFGDLGSFYALSHVVFLGGSFVPVGGHNLVEPAQHACALLVGPYMQGQASILDVFIRHQGVIQAQTPQALESAIDCLWQDPHKKNLYQHNAQKALDAPYRQSLKIISLLKSHLLREGS